MSLRPLIDSSLSYLKEHEDPRTANWPLMSTVWYPIGASVLYVVLVTIVGPKMMENRKPFELKRVLIFYNLFQVLFSSWLTYEFAAAGWLTGEYNFRCQPIDYSSKPSTMRMVRTTYWYYISKFLELPETFFFILRKKNSQINVLHVYHHGIMTFSGWLATRYYPSGHGTFPGLLNTFVHIVMYSYYLLSSLGPDIQKYLWWKKYLTTLQMVQFLIIMMHTFQLIVIDCNFPKVFVWYMGFLALSFYTLFRAFYVRAYDNKATRHKE